MAADTAAKRFSAMNMSGVWRGLNVVPNALIPDGERIAVMFFYSGITLSSPPTIGDMAYIVVYMWKRTA